MKQKSGAQLYLERVEMLDTIVANKLIERQQWKDLALRIAANMDGEKVKSSAPNSRMADAVVRCVDMEDEIDDAVARFVEEKCAIIKTIENLYSPTEYKLLHERYIQGFKLSDIADRWGWEYTRITTAHGRALKSVQNLLDKGVRQ